MLSLFVGVQLLGFWGLVFSVPIVGSVYSILFDILLPWRRREENAANQAPS